MFGSTDPLESRVHGELSLSAGVRDGENFLNPGDGEFIDITGSLSVGSRTSVWGRIDFGSQRAFDGFREGGVAIAAGPFSIAIAREQIRVASPALESSLLSGRVPMDAVYVGSRRPVSVPGLSWALGEIVWQFAFGPWAGTADVSQGWMAAAAAVAEPHPQIQVGLARVVRFSGPNTPGVTFQRIFRTAAFIHNSPNDWDDQTVQVHTRVRWRVGDHPVSAYLVLPMEDPLSSIWRDPGLQIGVTTPIQAEVGLFYLRYQYSAYGRRARWCPGCPFASGEEEDPASAAWYRHRRVSAFQLEGIPMGDPGGGYGASHDIRVGFWAADGRFRATGRSFFQIREDENLLAQRWPGKRRGVGLEAGWEIRPGLEGSFETLLTQGPRIVTELGFTVSVIATVR